MALSDADKLELQKRREQHAKQTEDDINQMDAIFSGEIPESQIIAEAAEEVDSSTEEVQDEVVASGEPEVSVEPEESVVEVPVAETPVVEPSDGYDFSDFINQMARDAMGVKPVAETPAPVATPAPVTPAPVVTPTPVADGSVELKDLVSIDEMHEAFQSPEKFIEILTNVAVKAAQAGAQAAVKQLPQVAETVYSQQSVLREQAAKFYQDNPELTKYKDFVRYCAAQVEALHPEYDYVKVFSETAKLAKARLPMVKEAAARGKRAASTPAFVDGQSNKTKNAPASGKLSRLEKELSEMPDTF